MFTATTNNDGNLHCVRWVIACSVTRQVRLQSPTCITIYVNCDVTILAVVYLKACQ